MSDMSELKIIKNNNIIKTYIIADLHFQHKKMQEYCYRPSNSDQLIINNWKNTVDRNDLIYVLGDVIWGNLEELKKIIYQLPGIKILIRGNHDKNHTNNWFIQAGFAAVLEKAQINGIILSHFPSIMNQEEIDRGIVNIHGHFHNNPQSSWEKSLKKRLTNNHFLLSLELIKYKPILLNNAIRKNLVTKTKERP